MVVVERQDLQTIGQHGGRQFCEPVEAGVECLEGQLIVQLEVVAQFLDLICVQIEPLQRLGDERVVKVDDAVVADVEPHQVGQVVEQSADVADLIRVQADGLQQRLMLPIWLSSKRRLDRWDILDKISKSNA